MSNPLAQAHRAVADAELRATEQQLQTLLASPLTDDGVLALTTLLGNVAHFFVYLEGNRRFLDEEALLPWRDVLLDGHDIRQAVLAALSTARCVDSEAERRRVRWTARLGELVATDEPELAADERELNASVEHALRAGSADRAALLVRLGADPGPRAPEAVFFRVMSGTARPETRAKLAQAWDRTGDRRAAELVELVDRIVSVRRTRARQTGHRTPLDATLSRCAISAEEAEAFVHRYLVAAIAGHERLGAQIQSVIGDADDPMSSFPYYLRTRTGDALLPELPIEQCLEVAVTVAEGLTGCTLRREDSDPTAVVFSVRSGDRPLGLVRVDLVSEPGSSGEPASVLPASVLPASVLLTGRALCRFRRSAAGPALSFDGAHSLFHEFGHAISQVLVTPRLPDPSGMEYLPVERLEDLSEWYEKWVYHPDFAARVARTADAAHGLEICRRVKRLEFLRTNLQRAVVAALDLDMHGQSQRDLRSAFGRLDAEHGIGRHCHPGDLAGYFTRPMFRLHPGLGLSYLWGYAYGAERFAPFAVRPLAELPNSGASAALASCFDPDLASTPPDVDAVARFYERDLIGPAP